MANATTKRDASSGVPVRLEIDSDYATHTIQLPDDGKVLIVTDGIIEQFGQQAGAYGGVVCHQFVIDGVHACLATHKSGTLLQRSMQMWFATHEMNCWQTI